MIKAESAHPRQVFQATAMRRVGLSIAFLLLAPFVASLPVMLYQRLSQGIWIGTPGLMVLGLGLGAIHLLILIQLVQAVRTRVVLGPEKADLSVPAGRWLTPLFSYRRHSIRYDDIQAVEKRQEVYGGSFAPVLMTGVRIVPKDGVAIRIGYVNALNEDPALPVVTIGEEIARRAGIVVLDKGAVHRSLPRKVLGDRAPQLSILPLSARIGEADIADVNRRHRLVTMTIGAVLAVLLVGGIVADAMAPPPGGTPRTAASAPVKAAKPTPAPAPAPAKK